jgi:hypothetical protein
VTKEEHEREIAELAYAIWWERGHPSEPDASLEDWEEAERLIATDGEKLEKE